jgi:hypothetical protein
LLQIVFVPHTLFAPPLLISLGGSRCLSFRLQTITLTLHSLATSKPAIGSGLFYLLFSLGSSYRKKGKEQGMYFDIKKYEKCH